MDPVHEFITDLVDLFYDAIEDAPSPKRAKQVLRRLEIGVPAIDREVRQMAGIVYAFALARQQSAQARFRALRPLRN